MITLPNIMIFFLFLVIRPVNSAFVNSYKCTGVNERQFKFTNFITNSSYDQDEGLLSFQFRTFALNTIVDVNDTSNTYTTLHMVLYYNDEVLRDDYLRLCEYAEVDRSTRYVLPPGVFYGLNSTTSSSMPSGALPAIPVVHSIDPSLKPSVTETYSSSVTKTAKTDSLSNNTTHNDPGFLPVPIAKRGAPSFNNIKQGEITSTNLATDDPVVVTAVAVSTSVVYENASSSKSSATSSASSPSGKSTSSTCPAYRNNEVTINYAAYVGHRSAFGTYRIQLSIIAPNYEHQTIACSTSYVNVEIDKIIPTYLVAFTATLLGLIFFSNMINTMLSPYQDAKDPFLMGTATICNAPLLNQLSPTYVDFLQYLYYVFFMAALNLQYPGFFIPLMTSLRWTGMASMSHGIRALSEGNVYETIFLGGLKALTLDGHYHYDDCTENWRKFLWIGSIYIGIHCVVHVLVIAIVELLRPKEERPTLSKFLKNSYLLCIGQIYYGLLRGITIPFLVYSSFLLTSTYSNFYGSPSHQQNIETWGLATASISLLLFSIIICYFTLKYVFPRRNREKLYQSLNVILVWQAVYSSYDPKKISFFIIDHLELLLFGIAVGTLQQSGIAQLILIITSQVIYFCLILLCQPYYSKTRMNRNKVLASLFKIVISTLHIPLIFNLHNGTDVRNKVTIAILLFHLVVAIFLFLVPTVLNLYRCFVQHYKYRKGILGIDIPDYRENGDLIELPMANNTNDDRCSNLSYSDLFSSTHRRTIHKSRSMVLSVASSENIQLYDRRVLPGVSVSNSYLPNISAVSVGGQKTSQQQPSDMRQSLGPPTTRNDWTTREVDLYYNAFGSEPDPEVKQFWEERGRKLYKADMIEQKQRQDPEHEEKNSTISSSPVVNSFRHAFTKTKLVEFGKSIWGSLYPGSNSYMLGKRCTSKGDFPIEPKGFEVMRPRRSRVKTDLPLSFSDPQSTSFSEINKCGPTTAGDNTAMDNTVPELISVNRESLYTRADIFERALPISEPKGAYLSSSLTTPVDSDQFSNNAKTSQRYSVVEDEADNDDTRIPFDFEATGVNRTSLYATSIGGNTVVGVKQHNRMSSHVSSFFSVGSSSGDWSSFVGSNGDGSSPGGHNAKKGSVGLLRVINDDNIGDIDEVESN